VDSTVACRMFEISYSILAYSDDGEALQNGVKPKYRPQGGGGGTGLILFQFTKLKINAFHEIDFHATCTGLKK
jgi:hypothetical protein